MPKKMIVYKRVLDGYKITKIPLRQVQVTDGFVGINKRGEAIKEEFIKLAEDLEGATGLWIDILSV